MILDAIQLEEVPDRPTIQIVGDDDPDSPDLRLEIIDGWTACRVDMTPERLAELRDAITEALEKLDRCEHGIESGDWCEDCNREYKQAEIDNA